MTIERLFNSPNQKQKCRWINSLIYLNLRFAYLIWICFTLTNLHTEWDRAIIIIISLTKKIGWPAKSFCHSVCFASSPNAYNAENTDYVMEIVSFFPDSKHSVRSSYEYNKMCLAVVQDRVCRFPYSCMQQNNNRSRINMHTVLVLFCIIWWIVYISNTDICKYIFCFGRLFNNEILFYNIINKKNMCRNNNWMEDVCVQIYMACNTWRIRWIYEMNKKKMKKCS